MTYEINDIAKYFGRIEDLYKENEDLKNELKETERKVLHYRNEMKELQDLILNYAGAIRRYEDEIHVLYHKSSTMLGFRNTTEYGGHVSQRDDKNRRNLQARLDEVEPINITFGLNGEPYSLVKHGTLAGMNVGYVSQYPEKEIAFC